MPASVFGRDAEIGVLGAFLAGLSAGPAALVLTGPAGAGKTTLIRTGLERAAAAGYTVLRTFPAPSDMRLAFAGLSDLLGTQLDTVLPELPPPQRRALGAALLIDDPPPVPPEPNVIAAAVKNAVGRLAEQAPVVILIDDVQWLDAPSAVAVSFAARRLEHERVGLLLALRAEGPDEPPPLELGRSNLATELLPLGGLSIGALRRLLLARLDMALSGPTLHRIHAESAGNPFIALEIGRALARRGITRVTTGPLPVPATLGGLVGERLRELPRSVADALAVLAVMPDAQVSRLLAAGVPGQDLDAAVLAGVVDLEAGRLRFAHPLLASAVLGAIPPARLRELHGLAARSAQDPEERARHRALSSDPETTQIAVELDEAARMAERRGAPTVAAELLELAASLTPGEAADDTHRRLLRAGRLLGMAGETRAAEAVLTNLANITPPGPRHAEVIAHLGWTGEDDFEGSTMLFEAALAEAGDAPALSARIHSFLSDFWLIRGELISARAEAYRAVEFAERAGDQALLASLLAHAFICDWQGGQQVDESQLERALQLERGMELMGDSQLESPSQVAALYLLSNGRLDEARQVYEQVLARAGAEGLEYVRADVLLRLSVIACRTGAPRKGAELARAGLEIAEQLDLGQLTSALLYGCGYAALFLGRPDEVAEFAGHGEELSRKVGDRVYLRAHDAIRGAVLVAAGDFTAAEQRLRPLIAHLPELGRRFESSWVPEIAEALIGVGDTETATELVASLRDRYRDPVTEAATARCQAQLAMAAGQLDEAAAELARAQQLRATVSTEPVPDGRILLLLGVVQRRRKQRRAARESLCAAIETFEGADAALWAQRAREELARVSGRAPGTGELTATELRVAELVAAGFSNRQAAAELFVTVRAVESTLTKIYAKLGVQSRTQLASRLRDGS